MNGDIEKRGEGESHPFFLHRASHFMSGDFITDENVFLTEYMEKEH